MPEQENSSLNLPTNNKTNWLAFLLIVAFLILLFGLLGILFLNSQKKPGPEKPSASSSAEISNDGQVKITKDGFEPESIIISQGAKVIWTNKDSADHKVASDPYGAANKTLPGLLSGSLSKNASYSFTFKNKGTFTYHDENNPYKFKGTIIVQ
jgi:plastocyanin